MWTLNDDNECMDYGKPESNHDYNDQVLENSVDEH